MVEELDDAGYLKIKTPEAFFHGIVGHVRDRQGQRVDGWAQSATLANYWRRYCNIAENTWPYHDYDDSQQDTLPQVTDPAAEAPAPSQVHPRFSFAAWHSSAKARWQFLYFRNFECCVLFVTGILELRRLGPASWTLGNPFPLSCPTW